MTVVYIASPYTLGDKHLNVQVQIEAASKLIDLGYCPIAPLLSHYIDVVHSKPYSAWLSIGMQMVLRSDVVLRLPGESAGADVEVQLAKDRGIPVFESISDLEIVFGKDTKHGT